MPPLVCASGGPIATVDLRVFSPSLRSSNEALPLRTISRLEEGDTIRYRPVLRPEERRKGDVTMVLVPANPKAAGRDKLLVFDPRDAGKPQQWIVPWRASLAAFVYGPTGLSVKKVEDFLDRDDQLVGELADYADKTAKAEALIVALESPDTSGETVNAALQGFSSKFGASAQLTRNAPLGQQATSVFRTIDPTIAAYDPLAGQGAQPIGQTAGLATSVAEMFFGSPIGLAAGGTAMLLNLGALAFPRSEFRSAFSQPMPDEALGLCGKVNAAAVHTRIAYLWSTRVPNAALPRLTVGMANSLPAGAKSPLPLAGSEEEWKYLDRARNWMVHPERGKPLPVKVQVLANTKSIELDLGKDIHPGRYYLTANWDWDSFQVGGDFSVQPFADFASAKLTPAAQDRFVTGTGKLPLTLEGADFEFVTRVEMKKLDDEFATASVVPYMLPEGLRTGAQDRMDIQVDSDGLPPGRYKLIVAQTNGKMQDVPLRVLPALPVIRDLPITMNQDQLSVSVDLKGERLDLLERMELSRGKATLGAPSNDGTQRGVVFTLPPQTAAGTQIVLQAIVAERSNPVTFANALRIVGPRPVISGVSLSPLPAQAVQLDSGELPGGLVVSAMMRVAHLPADGGVRLECQQTASGAITLHPGQQAGGAKLEQLSGDQLFLTFGTAEWVNGCAVQATVTSGLGDSPPHPMGRIVDVPAIDDFTVSPGGVDGEVNAILMGGSLESIEKVGWTSDQGTPLAELPQPLSQDGARQKLQVRLAPPPAPGAALYVWLRGESRARITSVHAN